LACSPSAGPPAPPPDSTFTSRHIEQVAADLKIRLVFSLLGQPRGRGKIERLLDWTARPTGSVDPG